MRLGLLLTSLLAVACADTHSGLAPNAVDASSTDGAKAAGSGGTRAKDAGNASGTRDAKSSPGDKCDHERESVPQPAQAPCQHAACTDGENGRCSSFNDCSYDVCFADSDCKGGPCVCASTPEGVNRCFDGNCQTGVDCGADGDCAPSYGRCGPPLGGVSGYYCHTPADKCSNDSDCLPDEHCIYEPAISHWLCRNVTCVG